MENVHRNLAAFIAVACLLSSGCSTLNSVQKAELEAMKASDAGVYVKEKSTGTATALGFLPGVGSFYTRQWGLGVVDLLVWPISILWDPIAGYEGAKVINYNTSKARVRRMLKKELRDLEDDLYAKRITEEEYRRQRRRIEDEYTFD